MAPATKLEKSQHRHIQGCLSAPQGWLETFNDSHRSPSLPAGNEKGVRGERRGARSHIHALIFCLSGCGVIDGRRFEAKSWTNVGERVGKNGRRQD